MSSLWPAQLWLVGLFRLLWLVVPSPRSSVATEELILYPASWIFLTMIFSNVVNGETVEFKYHNAASGEVVCLNEAIEFQSDMIQGNGFTPFLLTGTSNTASGNGSILYCEDEVPNNWVADCSDPEPNCTTNDTDDCNICGGGNSDE